MRKLIIEIFGTNKDNFNGELQHKVVLVGNRQTTNKLQSNKKYVINQKIAEKKRRKKVRLLNIYRIL